MRNKILNYLFQALCCAFCVGLPALIAFALKVLVWPENDYFAIYTVTLIVYFLIVSQFGLFIYYILKGLHIKWLPFIIILGTCCIFFILLLAIAKFVSELLNLDGFLVFFILTIIIILIPKKFIKIEDNKKPNEIIDEIEEIAKK